MREMTCSSKLLRLKISMMRIWTGSRVRGTALGGRNITEDVPMISRDNSNAPMSNVRSSMVQRVVLTFILR
jgi:hypothetical protein